MELRSDPWLVGGLLLFMPPSLEQSGDGETAERPMKQKLSFSLPDKPECKLCGTELKFPEKNFFKGFCGPECYHGFQRMNQKLRKEIKS